MKLIEEMLGDVRRFNEELMGVRSAPAPEMLQGDYFNGRFNHLKEELEELRNASGWADQADALVDLVYVALGALTEMGISPGAVFNVVHSANMKKVAGADPSRPENTFDAVKPEGWQPPDLLIAAGLPLSVLSYLSPVLVECARLRAERDDYNQTEEGLQGYFPFGHMSYSQMVHVKSTRLKSLMNAAKDLGAETLEAKLRDTLLDIINYSTYWVEAIDRGDRL